MESRLNVLRSVMHVLRYGAENPLNVLGYVMHVLRYGAESGKPTQCIKIGNACIKIGMHVLRYAIAFGNV